MKIRSSIAVLLAFGLSFLPDTVLAQKVPDAPTESQAAYFLLSLQEALRAGEPKQVAKLMAFPIAVTTPVASTRIADGNAFLQNYKLIFTESVRNVVLAQKSDALVRTAKGVVIGDGEVWFASVCVDTKCSSSRIGVIAVNVLPAKKK